LLAIELGLVIDICAFRNRDFVAALVSRAPAW
jgi:hypothetical protein